MRFPPSPTGPLHLGGGRTALFNWLFARQKGGIFLFRIEDSDKERSKKEYETQIIEALKWLGLDWDEGIDKEKPGESYRQSERTVVYRTYLEKLLREGHAYWCFCSKEDLEAEKQLAIAEGRPPKYSGRCRNLKPDQTQGKKPEVIRFKSPDEIVEFDDLIRGKVKTDMSLLGDFVIARNLEETPLYKFAVMIDDYEMKVTHVIRGEDHISNTPKQIVLQHALGLPSPLYGHIPLVLNADRSKLSKRYADVSLLSYRDKGYLSEAVINFLVLMGWHPSGNQEVFTLAELVKEFDISRVQKAGAIFNEEKLNWLNREHIKRLSMEELNSRLEPFLSEEAKRASPEFRHNVIEAVRERMITLLDFNELATLFFALPEYTLEMLIWKKGSKEEAKEVITKLIAASLEKAAIETLIETYGKGNVLWPLRVALSGREASPDPYTILNILGNEEAMRRLHIAEAKLG